MKNLIFILLIIAGCKKDDVTVTNSVTHATYDTISIITITGTHAKPQFEVFDNKEYMIYGYDSTTENGCFVWKPERSVNLPFTYVVYANKEKNISIKAGVNICFTTPKSTACNWTDNDVLTIKHIDKMGKVIYEGSCRLSTHNNSLFKYSFIYMIK